MAYKIKKKKGRPKASMKVRSIRGLTPKGFKYVEHKEGKLIFKKKKKK